MIHPSAPWSQQAIEDARAAAEEMLADMRHDADCRGTADPTLARACAALLDTDPSQWLAPEGVALDEYLDAIRYELCGIARAGQ